MKVKPLIMFLCFAQVSIAQQVTSILDQVNTYYETNQNYNLEATYTMFRGYTGQNITEQYTGLLYKDSTLTRMQVLNSEVLLFSEALITVDRSNTTIYYSDNVIDMIPGNPIQVTAITQLYKEDKVSTIDNTIRYEMIPKTSLIPNPYNKIVLVIDSKTYQLKKQEFYFANKLPFVEKQNKHISDFGRMEITYKERLQIPEKLKLSDILTIKDNNIQLASSYKAFKLVDRTKPNH